MKKFKVISKINMKLIVISLFLIFMSSSTIAALQVKKEKTMMGGEFYEFTEAHSVNLDKCKLSWQVTKSKTKDKKNIFLSLQSFHEPKCTMNFDELKPTHKMILKSILATYPIDTISGIRTPGLKSLNYSGEWNIEVAKASLSSKEWQDFRKYYPHHKSKKSSNEIFIDLVKQTDADKNFKVLFKEFGIELEMANVEKVFTGKLPPHFARERVIYDTGVIEWNIK